MTERNLLKLSPGKWKQQKEPIPLTEVVAIAMSPAPDSFCIVKCRPPTRDLVVDLGAAKNNRLAEFVSLLHLQCHRINGEPPKVEFDTTISFNQNRTTKNRGKDISLTFVKNPKPVKGKSDCVFKKLSPTVGQILYTTEARKCASQSCPKPAFKGNYCAECYNQHYG